MIDITDSSNVTGVDWNNGILRVRFKGGIEYEYYDVSFDKYQEFMAAPSKGQFVHQNLKGVHEAARV